MLYIGVKGDNSQTIFPVLFVNSMDLNRTKFDVYQISAVFLILFSSFGCGELIGNTFRNFLNLSFAAYIL